MTLKNNIFIAFTICFCLSTFAQSERKMARKGNTQYETGNFIDAEINYKKALKKNAGLLEAEFNLGDALVKQERFDEALESFEKVSSSSKDPNLKANALHNKGNVLLSQQDLEGALESYKDALRIDPKDNETRYNYAYVKKLLDQQQQEQNEENKDENKDDKDQNEENKDKGDQNQESSENEDKDKKEDQQDQGENKEDESEQDQQDKGQTDGENSDEEKQGEQPKPRENKLSPEESQRLLDALNQQEDKVQDKMKKHKLKGAKIKIEKDW